MCYQFRSVNHSPLILLLLVLVSPLVAESTDEVVGRHVIERMEPIPGKYTRASALKKYIAIPEGIEFENRELLYLYLDEKKQQLINLRVFESVDYTLKVLRVNDGSVYYRCEFSVVDSWTLIPVPYIKYDSNTGLRGGLKTYYNNFAGTLANVYLGMNIDLNWEREKTYVSQWSINPRFSNLRLFGLNFAADYMQQFIELQKYDELADMYVARYTLHRSAIAIGATIPLPSDFYYSFAPRIEFRYGYKDKLNGGNSIIDATNYQFGFNHSVGWSNLNWVDNMRSGLSFSLNHSINYVAESTFSSSELRNSLKLTGTGFYRWKWLNPSFRFIAFHNFNWESTGAGVYLRGIRDDVIYGVAGAFINLDLTITVIPWEGVGEAQLRPFFDIGMVDRFDKPYATESDLKYGTGLDFILYLDALKGMVASATVGIDLTNPDWKDWRKYEFSVGSSLHY